MKLAIPLSIAALIAAPVGLQAANLIDYVPTDSEMIISVNVADIAQSEIFERIVVGELGMEGELEQARTFGEFIEIDFFTEIEQVLVCGDVDDEESQIILAKGDFKLDKVYTFLKMEAQDTYEVLNEGGITVHFWEDDMDNYLAELGGGVTILTHYPDRMREAIETQKSGPATERFDFPSDISDAEAWMWAYAPEDDGDLTEFAELFDLRSALIMMDISDEGVMLAGGFAPNDEETLESWEKVLEGGLALGQLQQEDELVQEVAERAEVGIDRDSKTAYVRLDMNKKEAIGFFSEVLERVN